MSPTAQFDIAGGVPGSGYHLNWGIYGDPDLTHNSISFGTASYTRFPGVAISQGAAILDAKVGNLLYGLSFSEPGCNIIIYAEDADNADVPASGADLLSRPLTAGTAWNDVPTMIFNEVYETIDISAEVQQVINRPGWASGNALSIHYRDNGSTWGRLFMEYWPWIEITYDSGMGIFTEVVTAAGTAYGLNLNKWQRQNASRVRENFAFYLSDRPAGFAETALPITRFQATLNLADPSTMSVTVPAVVTADGVSYAQAITDRINGKMRLSKTFRVLGVTELAEDVTALDVTEVTISGEGARSGVTISGAGSPTWSPKHVRVDQPNYRRREAGKTSIRMPYVDPWLKPGDFVTCQGETFQAGRVSLWANARTQNTEVSEL